VWGERIKGSEEMKENGYYEEIEIKEDALWAEVIIDLFNERIRVEDYRGSTSLLIEKVQFLTRKHHLHKTIVKARQAQFLSLLSNGYECEALIPSYFNGDDAFFMVRYEEDQRRYSEQYVKESQTLRAVQSIEKGDEAVESSLYNIRKGTNADSENLSKLYKEVFSVYPTPLHDRAYVSSLLKKDYLWYVAEYKGEIVSAASADVNIMYHNAELTDCATLPSHRKAGLMKRLLLSLEQELTKSQIFCLYTIARAQSFGMNVAFHQLQYRYYGRLVNNCYIYKTLENMNVWVKNSDKEIVF
jgi:beta-lysine N6-acetyltransferase